jgi:hypothetical protein
MPSGRFGWLVAALGVALASGCGDAISNPKAPVVPASLPVASEGLPTASMFGALSAYAAPLGAVEKPPAVQVLFPSGRPVAGVAVTFAVTQGGGTVRDTLVFTDSVGVATCRWTLGPKEEVNAVTATASYKNWKSYPLTFRLWAVRADGTRYDLTMRDGKALGPGEEGFLLLANDSTFRTVWTWAAGTANPYVAINVGSYTRVGSTLAFSGASLGHWADGDLQNDVVTFSYDDYLDIGFHYVIVEVYQRAR